MVASDIGMNSFYACYKIQYDNKSVVIEGSKSFDNGLLGIEEFYLLCAKRNKTPEVHLIFVMEATGVYFEESAYFLYHKK